MRKMSNFIECLKEPTISNILVGGVLYVGFSLVLIIILIVIIFKILNKDKGDKPNEQTRNND